jgi:hypothetical protein
MIVIPMAGESRRFREAGFQKPKYMLPLLDRSLFAWSVGSFERYFESEPFAFVMLKAQGAAAFVRSEIEALGIRSARVVELEAPTTGQAMTVEKGLEALGAEAASSPITIFNIDTIRPGFVMPETMKGSAGYLEVFRGPGEHWSFVEPAATPHGVARTTEKERISDLCCTGLYYFDSGARFMQALNAQRTLAGGGRVKGEEYVAPMYNRLIEAGCDIRYHVIERAEVEFSGVPAEYAELQTKWAATPPS